MESYCIRSVHFVKAFLFQLALWSCSPVDEMTQLFVIVDRRCVGRAVWWIVQWILNSHFTERKSLKIHPLACLPFNNGICLTNSKLCNNLALTLYQLIRIRSIISRKFLVSLAPILVLFLFFSWHLDGKLRFYMWHRLLWLSRLVLHPRSKLYVPSTHVRRIVTLVSNWVMRQTGCLSYHVVHVSD